MSEDGKQMAQRLADTIAELREQRDELLTLIKYLHTPDENHGRMSGWDRDVALAIARAQRNP